jgi:hypothetical protein
MTQRNGSQERVSGAIIWTAIVLAASPAKHPDMTLHKTAKIVNSNLNKALLPAFTSCNTEGQEL